MLTDPQSVTVNAVPVSLPRTGINGNSADYTSADGAYSLRVQQSVSRGTKRTVVSLRNNKIAADPLTAVNSRVSDVVSVSFTSEVDGHTITELKDQFIGLSTVLTASSAATLIKILGGEK
jgi:hypothetical protein